jgi:hypothetical protein
MTTKLTIAYHALKICFLKKVIKVVQHVLLDKQLELFPVRTVYLAKLVQVKQIAQIVTLVSIKVNQVFHLVSNAFQVSTNEVQNTKKYLLKSSH